jgi:hypothetical protein
VVRWRQDKDLYNVPYDYRDQYADTRHQRVPLQRCMKPDPTTQIVRKIIELVLGVSGPARTLGLIGKWWQLQWHRIVSGCQKATKAHRLKLLAANADTVTAALKTMLISTSAKMYRSVWFEHGRLTAQEVTPLFLPVDSAWSSLGATNVQH